MNRDSQITHLRHTDEHGEGLVSTSTAPSVSEVGRLGSSREKGCAQQTGWGVGVFAVALFVALGHGWSVNTGLYLDDYAHFEHLKAGDWSYRSAVESSRLGIVGEVLDLWGRQEAGLRFYRPIAFWIMRAEYTVVHWRPLPMHLLSLGWHFGCSMLVGAVAVRCLGRRFWGIVAACLMAIHPGHVGTVYWIACQTELMTTLFLLVGLLAYARHAGWQAPWFGNRESAIGNRASGIGNRESGIGEESEDAETRSSTLRLGLEEGRGDAAIALRNPRAASGEPGGQGCPPPKPQASSPKPLTSSPKPLTSSPKPHAAWQRGSWVFAVICVVCYGLALGCRENAALFPLVCWLGDRLIGLPAVAGTSRRRWVRWEHVAMGLVFAVYMALRWQALGGFPVPPPPYMVPIAASAEFARYLVYKVVTYALGLFCCIPVVPIGGRSYFDERPEIFYKLFVAVLVLLAVIWAVYRFRRAMIWPIVWMACLTAPMMPVFASPHHLYLPSLGMVVLVTAGLAAITGSAAKTQVRLRRLRAAVSWSLILVVGAALALAAWGMGFVCARGVLSEDLLVRDVLRQNRPLRDGDHLFFINLPVLAYYAVPAIEYELGYRDLHGHVLVFSPDLICMESPGTVEVLDRHRFRVRAPDGKPYLSGVTGSMLLGVMGIDPHLKPGQIFDTKLFTVTIGELDKGGVRELLFEFREP
ncbi:MAG: hypothetical protein HY718_16665, partial [Planctomycetes bacterium]|nr:hypothetical protein [Planctomycetota bacterium]